MSYIGKYENENSKITIAGMQELMSQLQVQLKELRGSDSITTKEQIIKVNDLKRKIRILSEEIFKETYSKMQEISENRNCSQTISWGIKSEEPKEIFSRATGNPYYIKIGGREPIEIGENIIVSRCGKFKWASKEGLGIEQIEEFPVIQPFLVDVQEGANGKRYIKAEDLQRGMKEAENNNGVLDILKISIDGNTPLQYFMLCALPDFEEMTTEKFQEDFTAMCMSDSHKQMLLRKFEKEKTIYGGKFESIDGHMKITIDENAITAVSNADSCLGTYMLPNGEKRFGTLSDALAKIEVRQQRAVFQKAEDKFLQRREEESK